MHQSCVLLLCCLLGLGSAWNQPSTCYVQQSSCSSGIEKLDEIKETLAVIQQTLATSFNGLQQTIATSFDNLVGKLKQQRLYGLGCVYYWSNKIPWISSFSTFNGNTIVLFIVITSPGYLD